MLLKYKTVKNSPSRVKSTLLLLLMFISLVITLPVFQSTIAEAVKKQADMSFSEQIQSHIYLYSIAKCMKDAVLKDNAIGFEHITKENAASYNWFNGGTTSDTYVGPYMNSLISDVTDGGTSCSNSELIKGAFNLWGLDPIDVLCHSGFVRQDTKGSDGKFPSAEACVAGEGPATGSLYVPGELGSNKRTKSADMFMAYITSNIGNTNLNNAQKYSYYRLTLNEKQSCIPGIDNNPPLAEINTSATGYNRVKWVDLSSTPFKILQDPIEKSSYLGHLEPDKTIMFNVDTNLANKNVKCSTIVNLMNDNAGDFLIWAKSNPEQAIALGGQVQIDDPGANGKPTCGSQVSGIGWIICPVLSAMTKLDDGMWKLVSGLLNVNPINQSDTIYQAWGSIRSIANVVFVIFFLIIIFSQLTGAGITNYGVKKMLPKIIIAAILVNISFIIIQLAVDLANVIGSSLYSFIIGMAPTYTVSWGSALSMLELGVAGLTGTIAAVAIAGGPIALFFILLGLALISALGLLTAVLTLIFRQTAIIILALLAPLAFVAFLLPNTESWFKKWRGLLMSMLMMYPMAALVFAGAQFAAATIIGNGKDFWNILIGLTMMALPLFSLPFLARQGGPIISKVNGALAGVAKRANQPIRDMSKSYSDRAAARFQADEGKRRTGVLGGFQRVGRGLSAPSRHLSRAWLGGRQTREAQTETAKAQFKSQLSNNQVRGTFGRRINGEATDVAAAAAKKNLEQNATNTTTRLLNQNPVVNARHGETMGLNERGYAAEGGKEIAESSVKEGLMENRDFDELRKNIDHSKGGAETATKEAERRTSLAAGTLQVRSRTANATEAAENAESHIKSVVETASTNIDQNNPNLTPIEVEALGVAAVTRTGLAENKLVRKKEASATGQAVAAQNQEIAEVLLQPDNPTTGFVNTAVIDAAGKGGEIGQVRVQAGATQEQDTFRQANVTAARTLHTARQYSGADLLATAQGRKRTSPPGAPSTYEHVGAGTASIEEQEAATAALIDIGLEEDFAELLERAADPTFSATPEGVLFQQNLSKLVAGSPKRPKYIPGSAIGQLAQGTFSSNPERLITETVASRKLSMDSLKNMDIDEMTRMYNVIRSTPALDPANYMDALGNPDPAAYATAQAGYVAGRASLGAIITEALGDPRISEKFGAREVVALNNLQGVL